jgi:biotin carboxyl carrier protein
MEKKKLLFFTIGIAVIVSCLFSCNYSVKKERNQPVQQQSATFSAVQVSIELDSLVPIELSAKKSINIQSPKTGKLKKGDVPMKFGRFVRKGDLLVQLSFDEDYNQLVELKKKLSQEVNDFIEYPFIQSASNLRMKWKSLADELSPAKRLPPFPLIDSEEEKRALKQTLIGKYYIQATALERSIDEAFVFSPVTGWFNKVVFSVGDEVSQDQLIAEVVEIKQWKLTNKSAVDQLKGKEWRIVTNGKKEIGTLTRGTVNESEYTIQFTPGISLPYDKKYFVVSNQVIQAQRIPRSCFKNGVVIMLKNGQEKRIAISRVKQSVDSVWVTGLPEKCTLKQF